MDHSKGWKDQRINAVYQEMAEHYGTGIILARVRAPRDKPKVYKIRGCREIDSLKQGRL